MGELTFSQAPEPKDPYLVVGLGGWLNAAEVATGAVQYLVSQLKAQTVAEIDPEEFYDFSTVRPTATVEDGVMKSLEFVSNRFYLWRNEAGEHDLLFFMGMEPNLRWHRYMELVLQVMERFGVKRVYTVGSFYDAVPHTREPRVSATASHPRLWEELKPFNFEFRMGSYRGPTGILALLRQACTERNIEVIGLTARAPYYVKTANPRVCYAVLVKLMAVLDLKVDLESARAAGKYLDEMVDQVLSQNTELRSYVESLEKSHDAPEAPQEPTWELSDKIVREVEEFLEEERHRGESSS